MSNAQPAPGVVGPFAGMDVPWLLEMRARSRRDHPFLIWAPFDAPARLWAYGEFHDRVGALAAGLKGRGVKPGEFVLIHLDNCIEAMLAWFACTELGAIAVTTNTRSAAPEMEYFADHCGAIAAITQPAYAGMISMHCRKLRWMAVISHDAGAAPAQGTVWLRSDSFESLFADSAEPLGRGNVRDSAAVFRKTLLECGAGARLHLDLDYSVLHEGPAGTRDSESA